MRKSVIVAFLEVILSPLAALLKRLRQFRTTTYYWLNISAQVYSLERMLNDRYDSVGRRIRIDDGAFRDKIFIYTSPEQRDKYIYTKIENNPKFIYTAAEYGAVDVDFVIKIPGGVLFSEQEVTALVNKFKLVSKAFKIETIT
jgi:hypothetical protein